MNFGENDVGWISFALKRVRVSSEALGDVTARLDHRSVHLTRHVTRDLIDGTDECSAFLGHVKRT